MNGAACRHHSCTDWHVMKPPSCAVLVQNLITDDDMAQILGPLHPEVKCTIIAGASGENTHQEKTATCVALCATNGIQGRTSHRYSGDGRPRWHSSSRSWKLASAASTCCFLRCADCCHSGTLLDFQNVELPDGDGSQAYNYSQESIGRAMEVRGPVLRWVHHLVRGGPSPDHGNMTCNLDKSLSSTGARGPGGPAHPPGQHCSSFTLHV